MKLKIIALLMLANIATLCIAGNGTSKPRILKMPSAGALKDRALLLSINVEDLMRLELFEAFANRDILETEIEKEVDNVFSSLWKEHLKMIKANAHTPEFSDQLVLQGQEYQKQRLALKPVILMILRSEDPKQSNRQETQ